MSTFVPRQTYDEGKPDAALAKSEAVKALSKTKPWPGEAELKVRVDHPSTDGEVQSLAQKLGQHFRNFYASLPKDPRLMTESEKREVYQQIIAAFERENALTDNTKKLALLLAGLDSPGDSVTSPSLGKSEMENFMVDFRQKIATLREQVAKLVEARSKPTRFVTKATSTNEEVANPDQLLRKALANGRPVFPR